MLAERQQVIHALYPQIEKQVNREILLQAPVAGDLRFLLSVLRILPDLERSHHSVVEIASRANHILSQDLSPRARGLVERMGNLVCGMWRQAADSWYQRDRSAAFTLAARDQEMDELRSKLDIRTCLRTDDTAGGGGDDAGGVLLRASCRPRRQHRPPGDLPGRISDRLARWASRPGTPATARISADHLIGRTGSAILTRCCTVLVDGFAAGMWQLNRPASAATVTVEPDLGHGWCASALLGVDLGVYRGCSLRARPVRRHGWAACCPHAGRTSRGHSCRYHPGRRQHPGGSGAGEDRWDAGGDRPVHAG